MTLTQYTSMAVILLALAVEFWWIFTHRDKYLIAIPNVVWLFHSLIFYVVLWSLMKTGYDKQFFNAWGAALRLQGYLTILMMGLYRMNGRFTKWIQ